MFPKLNDAKLKEGIFDGPQIPKILNDEKFDQLILNCLCGYILKELFLFFKSRKL